MKPNFIQIHELEKYPMYITLIFSFIVSSCNPQEASCTEAVSPHRVSNCIEMPFDTGKPLIKTANFSELDPN